MSALSDAWARSRIARPEDEAALATELALDVGIDHARKVARVIRECGFTAEEICCVNGYASPHGDPDLVALAVSGWPLADTRRVLEDWAADAYARTRTARARA